MASIGSRQSQSRLLTQSRALRSKCHKQVDGRHRPHSPTRLLPNPATAVGGARKGSVTYSSGSVRQTVDLISSHDQFPAGLIRPSKVMANAFKAGFHLIAQIAHDLRPVYTAACEAEA